MDEQTNDSKKQGERTQVQTKNNQEPTLEDNRTKTQEKEKQPDNILEKAIMSWKKKYQQEYLKRKKIAIHGTKEELTNRIMGIISINEASKIAKDYKKYLREGGNSSEGETINKTDRLPDEEMDNLETVLKRKREENGNQTPNKINIHDDIRVFPIPTLEEVKTRNAEDMNLDLALDTSEDTDSGMRTEEEEGVDLSVSKITIEEEGEVTRIETESVATTKVDNITRTRIGIMVTIPPSKEPDKCLSLHLKKWFNKMQEIDKKFIVISWKTDEGPRSPIKEAKNIPTSMSKIRVYFTRAQVKTSGGKVYMDAFVQHTVPMKELRGDSEWFLEENKMAMYKKQLQVEETSQQGWLLYSTQALDNGALAAAIQEEIGVEIALRWKYINSINYVDDIEERRKWMALHIEVDSKEAKKAWRGLNRLYGRQSTSFPLDIRMRLVVEFKEVRGNATMIAKHTRLRARQASFTSAIEGTISEDIQMLDYEKEGMTLRDMIMSIQSRNSQTPGNLFHAVGRDWKGRFVFNYLKNKAEEARMIINGLIPYLKHKYGEEVNVFFDPEAVIEKDNWQWDEEKGILINPLSKELDGIEEMDDDYDFTGEEQESGKVEYNNKVSDDKEVHQGNSQIQKPSAEDVAITKLNLIVTGADTDSVSTLGNPATPSIRQKATTTNMMQAITGQSSISSVTETSMDSKISAIEQRISSMEKSITYSLEKAIAEITKKNNPNTITSKMTQLPGGELAGSQNE